MFSIELPLQKPNETEVECAMQRAAAEIVCDACEQVKESVKTDKDVRAEILKEWERMSDELLGLSE